MAKITINVEFSNGLEVSRTFEDFTEIDSAKEWLEVMREKVEGENKSEKQND